jgi:hypothetical protein
VTPHCGAPNDALRHHHGALGTTSAQGAVAQERGTQATEAEEEVAVASFIEQAQRVVGEARNQEFDAILRRRERTSRSHGRCGLGLRLLRPAPHLACALCRVRLVGAGECRPQGTRRARGGEEKRT